MEPLATIEELIARLPFVMDEDETREAEGALEDLSDDARYYGKASWLSTAVTPPQVCRMVVKAAVRHMKNPDGYTQSRAGDETLGWDGKGAEAGSAYFIDREIKQLQTMAGATGFYSVPLNAWNTRQCTVIEGLVPCEGTSTPFPMFSSDLSPWGPCDRELGACTRNGCCR